MKFIRHNGAWVPADQFTRPPRAFPSIIRDHCEPMAHPIDGRTYESKSAIRAVTRAHGYVELGNEIMPPREFKHDNGLEKDIAMAYEAVEQGYRPPPDATASGDIRMYGDA